MTAPEGAHLVGSVPLDDSEAVFRAAAGGLGTDGCGAAPDGEPGTRLDWIVWQLYRLMAHPQFEVIEPGPRNYARNPRVAVREDIALTDVEFGRSDTRSRRVHRGRSSRDCRMPEISRRRGGSR